ncbi:MAG: S1 RNA-binding domain-containing protein [Polyangiaceae bacterium]
MLEALSQPRSQLSPYAPRITTYKVKPDQIRLIIGAGGKTIKAIVDQTGVAVDVADDGTVSLASSDGPSLARALEIIKGLTAEPEVGATYKGTVKRLMDFGAFVEILPGVDGLVHISELAHHRVEKVEDEVKEGDVIDVKVMSVERDGKIRLSRKELLPVGEGAAAPRAPRAPREDRQGGFGSRGPREPRPERNDAREAREPREAREQREPREAREPREPREPRAERPAEPAREAREPRAERPQQAERAPQAERPQVERPQEAREHREPREGRERLPRELRETVNDLPRYTVSDAFGDPPAPPREPRTPRKPREPRGGNEG